MKIEPKTVYKINLIVAYLLLLPPQIPIKKYIGISNASKNMNSETKSPAKNTPFTAACKSMIDPRILYFLHILDLLKELTIIQANNLM